MLECTLALHGSLAQQSGHVVFIDIMIVYIKSIFSGTFDDESTFCIQSNACQIMDHNVEFQTMKLMTARPGFQRLKERRSYALVCKCLQNAYDDIDIVPVVLVITTTCP